jgi:hypothetical protein
MLRIQSVLAAILGTSLGLVALARDSAVDVVVQGDYTHAGTGWKFPERVAAFERGRVQRFDTRATDVGIGYRATAPGGRINATVFVYPQRGESLLEHLDRVKKQMVGRSNSASCVAWEAMRPVLNGWKYPSGAEVCRLRYGAQRAVSYAVLLDLRDWWALFRITLPSPDSEAMEGTVRELVRQLGSQAIPPP